MQIIPIFKDFPGESTAFLISVPLTTILLQRAIHPIHFAITCTWWYRIMQLAVPSVQALLIKLVANLLSHN